ncbi:MAG: class C sortase [Coriobacteriia bacterium]|nr:class C sortase [Coriobacteriia bacterium]
MKKTLITIFVLIAGVGIILYPTISNYFAEKNSSRAIRIYDDSITSSDDENLESEWEAAEQYNESLTGSPVHDPFIDGSGMAMPDDYRKVLDVDGVMGYIEIPKINVYLPIYHGTNEATLRRGVGHLEGSTLPIGGSNRHCVLTGHSALASARLFTDLTELQEGDVFFLYVLGHTLAYQVDQVKIVEPHNTDDLTRLNNGDYCTLLTCTPYGINSHRLLVRGVRIAYDPELRNVGESGGKNPYDRAFSLVAILVAFLLLETIKLVLIIRRKKETKAVKE